MNRNSKKPQNNKFAALKLAEIQATDKEILFNVQMIWLELHR